MEQWKCSLGNGRLSIISSSYYCSHLCLYVRVSFFLESLALLMAWSMYRCCCAMRHNCARRYIHIELCLSAPVQSVSAVSESIHHHHRHHIHPISITYILIYAPPNLHPHTKRQGGGDESKPLLTKQTNAR